MINSNKLPNIKKKAYDLAIHCITNYSNGYAQRIFNEDLGKCFMEDLLKVPEIERFQWKAIAGQLFNILQLYLRNFLVDLIIFADRNSLMSKSKKDLIGNNLFEVHFNKQYNRLEK